MTKPQSSFLRTFCRLCPVGCGLLVRAEEGRIVDVRGDKTHPMSKGYVCPKGLAAGEAHNSHRRLNHPLMRRDGGFETVSWPRALHSISEGLRAIIDTSGPASVGVYFGTAAFFDSGAQVARSLMKALGSRNWYTATSVDAPGWLLVAERMSGNPWLLPQPDPDAELVILIGINPIVSHGHNFYSAAPKSLLRNWASRKGLWVVDPRNTETASVATHHLRPFPGTDYMLLGYLVRELLKQGANEASIRRFTRNRGRLAAAVERFTGDEVARGTGLAAEQLENLVAAIRSAGRIAVHAGTGVSMSENANMATWLLWALNVITGSMDAPGGMWFNRGMMRDWDAVGWSGENTTEPGPRSRPELPARTGEMPSVALSDEIEVGNLRALIVIGGNPVISLPETGRIKRALSKLEVLAVLDVVPTGTTELATHVLPCAGQFERSDLSLSEIIYPMELSQFTPWILPPQAERRPVWWIVGELGRRMGCVLAPEKCGRQEDIDMTRLVASNPRFDIAKLISEDGGWHGPAKKSWGWVSRHLPGGRWDLAPLEFVDQLGSTLTAHENKAGSFSLLARRQRHKVNSTLNDKVADPHNRSPAGVFMHPDDAKGLGLRAGDVAQIEGRSGSVRVRVRIDEGMMPGCVSVPHGFEDANVGHLTSATAAVDRLSGMPTLTGFHVHIENPGKCEKNTDHGTTRSLVER